MTFKIYRTVQKSKQMMGDINISSAFQAPVRLKLTLRRNESSDGLSFDETKIMGQFVVYLATFSDPKSRM
jgi:hypothetical protein